LGIGYQAGILLVVVAAAAAAAVEVVEGVVDQRLVAHCLIVINLS
jgi:hypothetical protein